MPTFNLMPKEGLSLPRLSISVSMIIRLVLVCVDCVVIGIIGYYFAYYRGSYRQNLFHEELMVLVCATSAFINAAIFIVSSQYTYTNHGSDRNNMNMMKLCSDGRGCLVFILPSKC